MSKYIRLTEELRRQALDEFDKALSGNIQDGKISFTKLFTAEKRHAAVHFSEKAWIKMCHLIAKFNDEVAWHGTAHRADDETKDEYFIDDIFVYPQEVTGTTVNTDQVAYQEWLMSQPDEIYNNLRMQGHSHVNMSPTPSVVDTTHQGKILDQLDDEMFYIFMIWNKSLNKNIQIYDRKKNILFETADCTVDVVPGEIGLEAFLSGATEMVKRHSYVYQGSTKPAASPVQTQSVQKVPVTPVAPAAPKTPSLPANTQKPEDLSKKRTCVDDYHKPVNRANVGTAFDDLYGYSDDDDPYGPFGYRSDYWR